MKLNIRRFKLCLAAALALGYRVVPAEAQQAPQSFQQVDFFYTQSPQLFRSLFQSATTGTVRIAVIGDSQETSPTSHGYQYIPLVNYEMWKRFGNVPETPIEGCFFYTAPTAVADWLMQGGCSTPGPQNSRLSAGQILPNVIPKAFSTLNSSTNITGGSHGQLTLLAQDASGVSADAGIPTTNNYFNTSGSVKAEIFGATNASSGEISYIARPTTTASPSYSQAATTTGTVTLGLQSGTFAVKSGKTAALNFNGKRYMALEAFGSDDSKLTDIVGLRFLNETHPQGVIVDTFSRGGYTANDFLTNHASAGAMFAAFGFDAAVVHFGANEGGGVAATDFQTTITTVVARLRSWVGDPNFPVILIADVYQANLGAGAQTEYDKYTGAELAIAQADSNIMVINSRRLMEDIGWKASGHSTDFLLSDGIHYTALGAQVLSAAEVAAMMQEIHLSGCMSDAGSVTLPSTATLRVDVGGTTACSQFGQLTVAQAFNPNGATLDIELNNYTPASGAQFKLFNFATAGGTFGTVNLPAAPSGLAWDTSTLYTAGTIKLGPPQTSPPPVAPTISIASGGGQVVTSPASPTPIGFAITGSGTLNVSAQSSNTTLLPSAAVVISSGCAAGASCTATVTPASAQTGTTTITLTVMDSTSSLSASTATTLQINPASTGGSSPPPVVTPPSNPPSGGTTSGGGGGGAFDWLTLLALAGLGVHRSRARR